MSSGRKVSTLALLLAFLAIQMWAPLLHAHVQPNAASAAGLHLPDGTAALHEHEGAPALHVACETGDGALVTVPAEHRRDEAGLQPLPNLATGPTVTERVPESIRDNRPRTLLTGPHARPDNPPPLPAGPPRFA